MLKFMAHTNCISPVAGSDYLEVSVNDVITVCMFQTVEYLGDAATVADRILNWRLF